MSHLIPEATILLYRTNLHINPHLRSGVELEKERTKFLDDVLKTHVPRRPYKYKTDVSSMIVLLEHGIFAYLTPEKELVRQDLVTRLSAMHSALPEN